MTPKPSPAEPVAEAELTADDVEYSVALSEQEIAAIIADWDLEWPGVLARYVQQEIERRVDAVRIIGDGATGQLRSKLERRPRCGEGGEVTDERIGEYLSVRKAPIEPTRKTFRWAVLTNHGDTLGSIQWFGRWRQYCFDPVAMTTFNSGCLRDLVAFLDRVNSEHRKGRSYAR